MPEEAAVRKDRTVFGKIVMEKEVKVIKDAIHGNWWFYGLAIAALVLIIASWIWPPTAIIDSSVLAAVGELLGWGALGAVIKAIDKGTPASLTHNGTTITVNKESTETEEDYEA